MPTQLALPSGLVTFLFTDIEDSTRLAQQLGERYQELLAAHRRVLRRVLTTRGVELFTEGDSFFLAFANAADAIAGCIAAQLALAEHGWPVDGRPLVRMGLHTGRATPRSGEYASPEVHRAARVASAAHGGQILCSAETVRVLGQLPATIEAVDLGLHRLRGFEGRTRLLQLSAEGLPSKFPRPRTSGVVRHNLPAAVTGFVGRRRERGELLAQLSRHRLVTVVGAGGVGKSRLGVQLAAGLTERFADGVWYVDLADVSRPAAVAAAVADGLGVRCEAGQPLPADVARQAAAADLLLVLDTCDVAPDAARGVVNDLLAAGGRVRVLAIGREPLGLSGECVSRLGPLDLSAGPGGTPDEATTLLMQCAQAAHGGRRIASDDVPILTRVAAELEGLPLALELAGAQLRAMEISQLAERLDVMDLPVRAGGAGHDGRHESLHSSVDWSYRRLAPESARVVRALSAFAGAASLPAVREVAGVAGPESLAALVDASLVQVAPVPGGSHYRLGRPERAYAALALASSGEEAAVRGQHLRWVQRQLAQVCRDDHGRAATLSVDAFAPLVPDAQLALEWAVRHTPHQGLTMMAALAPWWLERGPTGEGRRWLCRLYDRLGGVARVAAMSGVDAAVVAELFVLHGRLAALGGASTAQGLFMARAAAVAQRSGDPELATRVRHAALAGATLLDEQACQLVLRSSSGRRLPASALPVVHRLAALWWRRGELDEAAELLALARPAEAAAPALRGRRDVDLLLGLVALARQDLVAAHDHLRVTLRSRISLGFHRAACDAIAAMAVRCAHGGDLLPAARLFGAASAGWTALGATPGPFSAYFAYQQGQARAAGVDLPFDTAYAQGTGWSIAAAAEAALAVEHPDLAANSPRFSPVAGPDGAPGPGQFTAWTSAVPPV